MQSYASREGLTTEEYLMWTMDNPLSLHFLDLLFQVVLPERGMTFVSTDYLHQCLSALVELSVRISAWWSVILWMCLSNYPYKHGYPQWTALLYPKRLNMRSDIRVTNIRARSLLYVRGCSDNSTRTSVILRISKRISVGWIELQRRKIVEF